MSSHIVTGPGQVKLSTIIRYELRTSDSSIAERSIARELCVRSTKSRVLQAITFTLLAAGVGVALSFGGWMLVVLVASAFFFMLLIPRKLEEISHPTRILARVKFELSMLSKVFSSNNYTEIAFEHTYSGEGRLFISALSNRCAKSTVPDVQRGSEEGVEIEEAVGAVLSINGSERSLGGILYAPSPEDWQAKGIAYAEINVEDHVPLSLDQLYDASDYINEYLSQGKNVVVHCLAGHGRSAMAIAAYLIKHQSCTVGDTTNILIAHSATIDEAPQQEKLEAFADKISQEERLKTMERIEANDTWINSGQASDNEVLHVNPEDWVEKRS